MIGRVIRSAQHAATATFIDELGGRVADRLEPILWGISNAAQEKGAYQERAARAEEELAHTSRTLEQSRQRHAEEITRLRHEIDDLRGSTKGDYDFLFRRCQRLQEEYGLLPGETRDPLEIVPDPDTARQQMEGRRVP